MIFDALTFEASPIMIAIAVLAGLLVWGALFVFAAPAASRRRALLRHLATALAIAALILAFLRPSWQAHSPAADALLITQGADNALLDSLLHRQAFNTVFALGATDPKWLPPTAQPIPDVAWIGRYFPAINQLRIAGHGLKSYDLEQLPSAPLAFHEAALQSGIMAIDWPREIALGERLTVHGRLSGFADQTGLLKLSDLAGIVDSLKFEQGENRPFRFSILPPAVGQWLYRLQFITEAADTLVDVLFGVSVREPEQLRILMLHSMPRFETRFLKEMLARSGHALAIRSAISRDRFRTEFINLAERDLSAIDATILQNFDLLIADAATISNLSQQELRAISQTIGKNGMGLLIMPDVAFSELDSTGNLPPFLAYFKFQKGDDLERREITPELLGPQEIVLSKIPALSMALQEDAALQPLIRDGQNRTMAALARFNLGRVGVTLIEESYRWVLAGDSQAHAAYWSFLITRLARSQAVSEKLMLPQPPIYFVDEPLSITLHSPHPMPGAIIRSATQTPDSLRFRQNELEPQRWRTTFWPRETGWYTITSDRGAETAFYVLPLTSWPRLQQAQKHAATRAFVRTQAAQIGPQASAVALTSQPVSLVYFFIIFLLSCTYLWAERKF